MLGCSNFTELCYKRHRPIMFTLFVEIKLLLIAVSALGLEKVFPLRKITHSCFKCPHTFWDLCIFPFKLLKRQIFIHKALKLSTPSNHVHCTCQSWMTTLNNTLWANRVHTHTHTHHQFVSASVVECLLSSCSHLGQMLLLNIKHFKSNMIDHLL